MGFLSETFVEKLIGKRGALAVSAERIYCRACRVAVNEADGEVLYRITVVMRSGSYADAEEQSERFLAQVLRERREEFPGELSLRWLKVRPIGGDVAGETETVKALLSQLRRDPQGIVFAIERRSAND